MRKRGLSYIRFFSLRLCEKIISHKAAKKAEIAGLREIFLFFREYFSAESAGGEQNRSEQKQRDESQTSGIGFIIIKCLCLNIRHVLQKNALICSGINWRYTR